MYRLPVEELMRKRARAKRMGWDRLSLALAPGRVPAWDAPSFFCLLWPIIGAHRPIITIHDSVDWRRLISIRKYYGGAARRRCGEPRDDLFTDWTSIVSIQSCSSPNLRLGSSLAASSGLRA